MFEKRSRFEIILEILRICKSSVGITRILYQCNMSYHPLQEYVALLLAKGLLEREGSQYQTTDFGELFCEGLESLMLLWQGCEVLCPNMN